MNSLKIKISSALKRAKPARSFLGIFRKTASSQADLDKRLVYALSSRKLPSRGQLKHLNKFLNPREYLLVKICLLIVIINLIYLGVVFIGGHLKYLPVSGGTYTEGVVGYPKNINPLYAVNRDVDSDLSRLIYSSLFKYDANGKLVNDLAEELVISDNNREYLIKIRPDVKWHTGGALTVDDVLFTFNLIKNNDYRSPLRAGLAAVTAEKIDSQTIKFTLADVYSPFPELLTFSILPKNIWENVSANAAALSDLNLKPVGSGPYKFKSLIRNSDGDLKEYHLVANDKYYGREPYIKNIVFKFFVDYPEMIKAFNNNQLDGLSYLPFASRGELLAPNSVVFNELVQAQVVSIFFNRDKDKSFDNKNIRTSLAQAIDKDQIIKDVFSGVYQRADSPIVDQDLSKDDKISKYNYSPTEARVALQGKFNSTTLTVIDSNNNVAVAEKIKNYWEAVGLQVELKIVSSDQGADIIKNRNFESLLYGESVGGDPDVYVFWHSSQIGSRGFNLAGYNNPTADKLLLAGRTTTNIAERQNIYRQFQEVLTADAPVVFLYSPGYTYIQNKKIKGFTGSMIVEPADRFSGIVDWYIKTNKKLTW